jgi:hypothetical protein
MGGRESIEYTGLIVGSQQSPGDLAPLSKQDYGAREKEVTAGVKRCPQCRAS